MIKALGVFVRSVSWFNSRLGKGIWVGVCALIGILLYAAVLRYVFNSPPPWAMEIEAYTFAGFVFLSGGYVLLTGAHIRMDAIYSRWSVRRQAVADAATFALAAIWLGVWIWRGFIHVKNSVMTGERFHSGAQTLIGPIKVIMLVGLILLLIQAIALFIQDLSIARGKPLQ